MSVLSAAKGLIYFIEIVLEDLKDHPLDTAPWLNASVYLGAMLFFDVTGWKALVAATVILFTIMYNYGRRTLIRGGMAVLFFTLAVWTEIIPDRANWNKIAHSVVAR